MPSQTRLMGLIDGAAHPAEIYPLLQKSGATYQSVYAGLPEEALGWASLFLVEIDDPGAAWVAQLDRLDLQVPCLSLIWSRVGLNDLATHLRAFLLADIGDGMTAMIRYFDPRNTAAVFRVWGEPIRKIFIDPIERWLYRERHSEWQRIENDMLKGSRICPSITIRFNQAQLDLLAAHSEPDEVLAGLICLDPAIGKPLYLERFSGFIPRYRQALQWGLEEPADRLRFCHVTYKRGVDFDRHPYVHAALTGSKRSGAAFCSLIEQIPAYVWEDVERASREPEARR